MPELPPYAIRRKRFFEPFAHSKVATRIKAISSPVPIAASDEFPLPAYDPAAHQAAIDDLMYVETGFRRQHHQDFTSLGSLPVYGTSSRFLKEPKVKIIIPVDIYGRMIAYAKASKGEVSGFGKVRMSKKGGQQYATVIDIRIFEQTVNPAHTSLQKEDLHPFLYDLALLGEDPAEWNLWWHSHNDFTAFFSHEDMKTIESLSCKTKSAPATHLYSVCVNKAAQYASRHDYDGKLQDEDNLRIDYPIDEYLEKAIKKEVQKKVTFKPTIYRKKEFRTGIMRD